MKRKSILAVLTVGVLGLSLAGCSPEEQSAKELYSTGYSQLMDAKSYTYKSSIGLDVKVDGAAPEEMNIINALNSAKIEVNGKVDSKLKKSEIDLIANFEMGMLKPEIRIPMLIDEKGKVSYMKLDYLIDEFGGILPMPQEVSSLKGKLLKSDLEDPTVHNMNLQKEMESTLKKFASDLKEEQFQSIEVSQEEKLNGVAHKVKVILGEKEVKGVLTEIIDKAYASSGQKFDVVQYDKMMKAFEDIKVKEARTLVLIDEKGSFISEEAVFHIGISSDDGNGSVKITVSNEYDNFGEKVSFTIDPSKEEVVDMKELEEMGSGF